MSIEFKDYQKLVSQQAWKALARLHALGVHSMDYEDVFQEMCLNYTVALKTFDPSKGFVFTTYLVTVMQRRFNRIVESLVEERRHITSVEEIESSASSDGDFSLYDMVATDEPLIEDRIAHEADVMAKVNKLSAPARGILMELINPSAELEDNFQAKLAHIRFGRELGVANNRMSSDLNINFVCEHYGITGMAKKRIRDELKSNFGVIV